MKIETYEKTIDVPTYIAEYVNVEEFLACCRACDCYGNVWSCPPYDFSPVEDVWEKYSQLYILGKKLLFNEAEKPHWEACMDEVKAQIRETLFAMEAARPGSVSLSAGNCHLCGRGNCSRPSGAPCRFPEQMRYSLESLGGNVGLTASKLLGLEIQWMEAGRVPDYFVLVGGLLY